MARRAAAQRVAAETAARAKALREAADAEASTRAAATRLHEAKAARLQAGRRAAEAATTAAAANLAREDAARDAARSSTARVEATRVEAARIEAAHREAVRIEARAQALRIQADEGARLAMERAAARDATEVDALRAGEAARAQAALPPVAGAAAKTPAQTLIMVADDSKIVRVKTGRLLAQHHYQVSYAVDGLDAARQLEAGTPDIVITDVEMPGMDGFALTRHVRANPLTAHIPIIMITAADDRHREDADRAGVSILLGKPYPEEALIDHIRTAMQPAAAPTAPRAAVRMLPEA